MSEGTERVTLREQVGTIQWNFWIANSIELMERLAFFGVRAVLPLYMIRDSGGALGLSYAEKGAIYMVWALLQCLIPMVSGGYTESYGYRKSMYVAFVLNIAGYLTMAASGGFWTMMMAGCLVGTGTAIFKPPVQGAVAKSLHEGNSGLGFGIFYWIVNIGGFFGPMIAVAMRGTDEAPTWDHVFYGAAIVTAINFLPAMFLFKEPELDPAAKQKRPMEVFKDTMKILWKDQPMLRFLLVVSGFWFMFMQLWDLMPNFIDEWVDTRDIGAFLSALPFDGLTEKYLEGGAAKADLLINIDALTILLLVMPISWLLGRFKMMTVMVVGMSIAVVGFVGTGMTPVGWACAFMIFVFAIGEIICSPKFSEYIGMTAPKDKKALYMGYANIPFAIGWAVGNGVSGPLYDKYSSISRITREHLVDVSGWSQGLVDYFDPDGLLASLFQGDLMAAALKADPDAVRYLWDSYDPWIIWIILGAVGVLSLDGMWLNYRRSQKRARLVGSAPGTGAEER